MCHGNVLVGEMNG